MGSTNYGEVPMEGEFLTKPDLAPKVKDVLGWYYTDKSEPLNEAPDGVGPDRKIPKAFEPEPVRYDPYCNYDGYEGGNKTMITFDEYKILNNTVKSVPVEYAEDCQTIDGMNGSERI
jgi:hypothetical protein